MFMCKHQSPLDSPSLHSENCVKGEHFYKQGVLHYSIGRVYRMHYIISVTTRNVFGKS
jgi:hypothetical protein